MKNQEDPITRMKCENLHSSLVKSSFDEITNDKPCIGYSKKRVMDNGKCEMVVDSAFINLKLLSMMGFDKEEMIKKILRKGMYNFFKNDSGLNQFSEMFSHLTDLLDKPTEAGPKIFEKTLLVKKNRELKVKCTSNLSLYDERLFHSLHVEPITPTT
eukprot:TRINITY_DN7524_c0_g1_i2.p1 TRINITY_DN7524_c0_g1~~TRINITY_DN7524_c0_g1_i2.p1  ORF type:complete len:157 (+),score=20.04 TRINITY_DN7524_c0_g1_i2:349-819(+)